MCAAFPKLAIHWWIPNRIERAAADKSHMSSESSIMAFVHRHSDNAVERAAVSCNDLEEVL